MNNNKNSQVKNILGFVSVYTFIFLCLAFVLDKIFDSEGKTFIWSIDGLFQHVIALKYIRQYIINLFTKGSFPMIDFNLGQGFDVIGTLNYYGFGDPVTIFTVLFPENEMELMYEVLIFIRMYLSGLFVAYLLKTLGKTKTSTILPACILYPFCNYALLGGIRHPMFFNGIMYLPLLIAAVERVITKKKIGLLVFVVSIAFINNYYFMYINTVMATIYFFVRQIGSYRAKGIKELAGSIGRIVISYIWGTCMGAMLLIPSVYAFLNNVRTTTKIAIPDTFFGDDYYEKFLKNFIITDNDMNMFTIPGIGILGVIAIVVLLIFRKSSDKKILTLFAIMFIMLLFPMVGKMMNGFSYVTMRFSYGMALILSVAVAFAIDDLRSISILDKKNLIKLKQQKVKQFLPYLVTMASVITIVINMNMIFGENYSYNSKDYVNKGTLEKEMNTADVKMIKSIKDDSFYRIERVRSRSNKSAYCGFNQTGFYYSIIPGKMTDMYVSTCLSDCYRSYVIKGLEDRIGMLALASTKYYGNYGGKAPYGFEKIEEETIDCRKVCLYENKNYLPLGVTYSSYMTRTEYDKLNPIEREMALLNSSVVDNRIEEKNFENSKTKTESENNKATSDNNNTEIKNNQNVTGVYTSEMKINNEKNIDAGKSYLKAKYGGALEYNFNGLKDCLTYIVFKGVHVKDTDQGDTAAEYKGDGNTGNLRVIGDYSDGYYYKEASVFNIGYSKESQNHVDIKFNSNRKYTFKDVYAAMVHASNYDNAAANLKKEALENVKLSDNHISGNIKVSQDKILQLSIPYSKGYKIYVDGKKTETFNSGIGYIGAKVLKGRHTINVTYKSPGIVAGAMLTIISTLFWAFYVIRIERVRKQ